MNNNDLLKEVFIVANLLMDLIKESTEKYVKKGINNMDIFGVLSESIVIFIASVPYELLNDKDHNIYKNYVQDICDKSKKYIDYQENDMVGNKH